MPPILALTLALGFSSVLLIREAYQQKDVSRAVWIPCIWLLILGSRPISVWFSYNSGASGVDAMMEGSPVDRVVYLVLMFAAFVVVMSRRLPWREVVSGNRLLVAFIVYCALSVVWSDFPFLTFKRWFKSLGDPLMALVLLSEASPALAVASLLRRCAYVLLPFSIVFIKYFPQLGRSYDDWSGMALYTGVTTNKNMLGYLLLVFGLFFLCTVLTRRAASEKAERRAELAVALVMLAMVAWLIRIVNSQTAIITLALASSIGVGLGSAVMRKYFGGVALAVIVVGLGLQWMFDIFGIVLESLGRDATLTGRTNIWTAVLALSQNPLIGSGFQSFWLGDRLQTMWDKFPVFKPNQAHNGYIEMYLNLGWIGILLFVGVLVAFYRNMREKMELALARVPASPTELALAKFATGYFAAYLLYNVTEAIFQPLNFLFIVMLVLGIRYPEVVAAVPHRVGETPRAPSASLWPNVRQWHPSTSRSSSRLGVAGASRAAGAGRPVSPGAETRRGSGWSGSRTDLWSPPPVRRKDKYSR